MQEPKQEQSKHISQNQPANPKPIELTKVNDTPAFNVEHTQPVIKAVGALNPPPTDDEEEKFESYYDEEDEDEVAKVQQVKIGKSNVQQIFSSMSTG